VLGSRGDDRRVDGSDHDQGGVGWGQRARGKCLGVRATDRSQLCDAFGGNVDADVLRPGHALGIGAYRLQLECANLLGRARDAAVVGVVFGNELLKARTEQAVGAVGSLQNLLLHDLPLGCESRFIDGAEGVAQALAFECQKGADGSPVGHRDVHRRVAVGECIGRGTEIGQQCIDGRLRAARRAEPQVFCQVCGSDLIGLLDAAATGNGRRDGHQRPMVGLFEGDRQPGREADLCVRFSSCERGKQRKQDEHVGSLRRHAPRGECVGFRYSLGQLTWLISLAFQAV